MAKEYGKRAAAPPKEGINKQLVLIILSFIFGVSTTFFDFSSLRSGIIQLLSDQDHLENKTLAKRSATIPKPKFEFYTLLANEHPSRPPVLNQAVNNKAAAPIKTPMDTPLTGEAAPQKLMAAVPSEVSAKTKASPTYLLQVAAFKTEHEAERLKAQLALKGFTVSITSVMQQQTQWYRVIIGPFPSHLEAEKVQNALAQRGRMVGMIRKMA